MASYTLNINKTKVKIEAEPDTPLLWIIRDEVNLKGTKFGCGQALCGACTVHLNGQPIRSCQTQISFLKKSDKITTIEGVNDKVAKAVQKAWTDIQVPQCGYCQSGQIMSAVALLTDKPRPTDQDIDSAMSGNICRCGAYLRIREAIHKASAELV